MKTRSFTFTGVVLKRYNSGETDRIVTVLTQEFGKIACVAKGVRNLHSSRRASLEPGNIVKAFCVQTHSLPLLTQSHLIADTSTARDSLKKMRQITQFLEIVDRLFVEEEIEPAFFSEIVDLREQIISDTSTVKSIRKGFEQMLVQLGYHDPAEQLNSILEKVSEVTQRPVHSYEYLVVKPQ